MLQASDLQIDGAMKMMLQRENLDAQLLKFQERNSTHLAIFQRDCAAAVPFGADRIDAQNLSGHLEAGILLLAAGTEMRALEMAKVDCVEKLESVARPVQWRSALNAAADENLLKPQLIGLAQILRQAGVS